MSLIAVRIQCFNSQLCKRDFIFFSIVIIKQYAVNGPYND